VLAGHEPAALRGPLDGLRTCQGEDMPRRTAAQLVTDLARALLGGPLPLGVRCWDGSEVPGPPGAPTLIVTSPRALRRIVYARDELGPARAYVSGELDVEGDLFQVLELPDNLPVRPRLRLDHRALRAVVVDLARTGALGRPPPPPAEEARLRGLRHSVRRDRAAVSHHYDAGNDFYALLLGPTMVYSCAYFATPATSLEDAQRAKLDLVCRKLDLDRGMRLLDVGCGWGSLVLHAASAYGVRAVGVTISSAQADLARRRVTEAGLADRVEIRLQDYREVTDGPYDAIASVGMAEHVGRARFPGYAAGLRDLLAPGGRLLNHAIALGPDAPGGSDPRSFFARYVFPDGELQPLGDHVGLLERAGLEVRDVEGLREHYALTCRAWVANLEARWEEAVRLVSPGRARVWRLYLAGAAVAFERRRVGVDQVLATRTTTGLTDVGSWPLRRPDWSRAQDDAAPAPATFPASADSRRAYG
jgi:cyclopropane-fatty-acyl-phospholipid synthase